MERKSFRFDKKRHNVHQVTDVSEGDDTYNLEEEDEEDWDDQSEWGP